MSVPGPSSAFPPLELDDLDGVARPLAEAWSAGPALVAVGNSECRTALLALPYVDRLHRRLGSRVLLVLQDDPKAARGLVDELSLALPVRLERDPYPLARALGLVSVPTFYLVDETGRIVRTCEGFSRLDLMELAERMGVAEPLFTAEDDAPAFRPG